MLLKSVVVALLCFFVAGSGNASYPLPLFEPQMLQNMQRRYGDDALARLEQWRDLLLQGQSDSDWDRLNKVNTFFNHHLRFKSDSDLWGQTDYWATPLESLATAAGDCEDYVIAKYVSLRAMGISDLKLRIMYVRALSVNEPHMVLIYLPTETAVPLVLDNMQKKIQPATQRTDLKPIYSFNAEGLWLAKANGLGRKVAGKTGGSNWQNLLKRIEKGT
jgi:predicted transglutaminase-like cysteine proteinase